MIWNVWRYNINSGLIEMWNIFEHWRFNNDVEAAFNRYSDNKEKFAEQLKDELLYNFWCKSEYEIVLSPWCRGPNDKEKKIDIYMQVMANWDKFLDYVWDSKKGEIA